jgi:SAM-dependent methyltransferase
LDDSSREDRTPTEWVDILRRDWEARASLPSRDLFVASHPGWRDPATWERFARAELAHFLMDLDPGWLSEADVLEIGCGSGRLAPFLRPRVRSYTGFDISRGMVEAARIGCAGMEGVRFFAGDGLEVPRPARDRKYRLALAVAVFIHCPRQVIAANVRSAFACLAPGGQLRFQVLADPSDGEGLSVRTSEAHGATESIASDSRDLIAGLSEEERRLVFDTYYMGDRFRYAEVEPFVSGLTGGRVALYRGDLASTYGLVERPKPAP